MRYKELFIEISNKGEEVIIINYAGGMSSLYGSGRKQENVKVLRYYEILKLYKIRKESVIVLFDEASYLKAKLINLFLKIPIIVCPRGNKLIHNPRKFPLNKLKKIVLRYIYNDAKGLVLQTKTQAREFKVNYNIKHNNLEVVNNSINASWIDKITSMNNSNKLEVIGFIGDDGNRKGFDIVLNAFNKLKAKGLDNLKLYICGHYSFENKYEGVSNYGQIDNMEIFYSNIDLLVIPSRYDSFPNVILEALKANVPVIGSNKGTLKEILKYDELLFGLSTDALSMKIEEFALSEEKYNDVNKLCQSLKDTYDFDWAELFIKKLNILLSSHKK